MLTLLKSWDCHEFCPMNTHISLTRNCLIWLLHALLEAVSAGPQGLWLWVLLFSRCSPVPSRLEAASPQLLGWSWNLAFWRQPGLLWCCQSCTLSFATRKGIDSWRTWLLLAQKEQRSSFCTDRNIVSWIWGGCFVSYLVQNFCVLWQTAKTRDLLP